MTTTDDDLLLRLRRCTGPLHERIEAVLRLEAPMPLVRYARVLRGFHEFLQLWEPRVRAALPGALQPWFDGRRRAGMAERDVHHLSAPMDADIRASAQRSLDRLRLDSAAAAFGAMYVIEGSALGGQVLTPQIAAMHGLSPERGIRYFHGFGERTGAMWREFRQLVTQQVGQDAAAHEAACQAAQQTFQALIETFESMRLDEPALDDTRPGVDDALAGHLSDPMASTDSAPSRRTAGPHSPAPARDSRAEAHR